MPRIAKLSALEILDSRGRPTVAIRCDLEVGASARASVHLALLPGVMKRTSFATVIEVATADSVAGRRFTTSMRR